ncbi:hypothetical protein KIN20_034421 [Parelaphostrongylus tenuis]|uniref:Histone H4 n=1 Tax=Parelaphostrongylus tenuis TaxID=148309 RepID=A0AAD5RA69_PARTN|nr:hypothetical protein KIN20_034421 [Parelaphostrongylus tenuis]
MCGRGKGDKGLGKGGTKRYRIVLYGQHPWHHQVRDSSCDSRGDVKRIFGLIFEETRGVLKMFLENIIRDAISHCKHT